MLTPFHTYGIIMTVIKMLELYKNIKSRRVQLGMSQQTLAEKTGYSDRSSIAKIESGLVDLTQTKIHAFANALHTTASELMGWEDEDDKTPAPNITEDYTTFPVIGDIAAGYEHTAIEDWEGETVNIPNDYLKGRRSDEFFVLRVKGDSMFPSYQDGDKVLVLKQSTLNYSGQVGVVLYNGDFGTLKKVEYVAGEDWMSIVPINPSHPPVQIEGADLEQCRILGIPKLLIREINN